MTAEKHHLDTVQNTLQESARGCSAIELIAPNIKDAREYASMMKAEIDAALTALTLYMSQPQSCAECERLGRENRALAKFILQHEEEKFYGDWACRQCYPHSEHLREGFVCAYHMAATIAAAGGD